MFPIKYIDNNLVWNKDNEVFAYYGKRSIGGTLVDLPIFLDN